MNTDHDNSYNTYGELWNYNVQKITEIQNTLEKNIQDLETYYVDFESFYDKITDIMSVLTSVYSSINVLDGNDYVLQLKALLETYRERYTRESIDFNLLGSLLSKISASLDYSFKEFPRIAHRPGTAADKSMKTGRSISNRPYKWITFERNGSFFITSFKKALIKKTDEGKMISFKKPYTLKMKFDDTLISVKDVFSQSLDDSDSAQYILIINNGSKNFAIEKIHKKIYSYQDIITDKIKPFTKIPHQGLTPGRVRIFGRSHILLN